MKDSSPFKKAQRIHSGLEFDALFKYGNKISGYFYTAFFIPRAWSQLSLQGSRLAISIPKRLGNAVIRNRNKRIIREFFRTHIQELPQDIDILLFQKTRSDRADQQTRELAKLWHLLKNFSYS